jgi:hypothetical protein
MFVIVATVAVVVVDRISAAVVLLLVADVDTKDEDVSDVS